jgi:hypothetical protein
MLLLQFGHTLDQTIRSIHNRTIHFFHLKTLVCQKTGTKKGTSSFNLNSLMKLILALPSIKYEPLTIALKDELYSYALTSF